MNTRRFTLSLGIVLVVFGFLGFVPVFNYVHEHIIMDNNSSLAFTFNYLFNLFPVNPVLNVLHIGLGLWAIIASKNFGNSRQFCKSNAIIFGILALVGLVPMLDAVFGYLPLFGNNIWLHALVCISCAYFGWSQSRAITRSDTEGKYPRAA